MEASTKTLIMCCGLSNIIISRLQDSKQQMTEQTLRRAHTPLLACSFSHVRNSRHKQRIKFSQKVSQLRIYLSHIYLLFYVQYNDTAQIKQQVRNMKADKSYTDTNTNLCRYKKTDLMFCRMLHLQMNQIASTLQPNCVVKKPKTSQQKWKIQRERGLSTLTGSQVYVLRLSENKSGQVWTVNK